MWIVECTGRKVRRLSSMVLPPTKRDLDKGAVPGQRQDGLKGGCCHGIADSCVVRFPGGGVDSCPHRTYLLRQASIRA